MRIAKIIPVIALFVIGFVMQADAQKVGHLNASKLLNAMPEMKSANTQLEAYSKQKEKSLKTKATAVESFYVQTMQDIQAGKLSPVQQQQKESELQRQQQDLAKAQQEAQSAIAKKQSDLYQPVINKVNEAIKAVGERNGFDYIFDSSMGALIHTKSGEDVYNLVKAELGI